MSGSCSVVCGMSFPCRRRVVRGSSRLVRVCRVCGVCRVSGVCRIRRDGVPVGVSGLVRTFFCPVLVRGLHIRPTVPVLPHGVAASGLGRNTEPSASSPLRRGRRAGARSRPPDERGRGGGFSDAANNIRPRPTDLQDDWEVSDLHSAANRRILSEAPSAHTSDGLLHIAASCGFVRLRRGVPACRGAFRRCRGPFASRHSGFRAFSRRCFWGTPVFGGGGPCDGGCRRRFVGCARRSPSLGRGRGRGREEIRAVAAGLLRRRMRNVNFF